jgi:hypothetical protein
VPAGAGRGSRGAAAALLMLGHPGAVAPHGRRRRSLLPHRYVVHCVLAMSGLAPWAQGC